MSVELLACRRLGCQGFFIVLKSFFRVRLLFLLASSGFLSAPLNSVKVAKGFSEKFCRV